MIITSFKKQKPQLCEESLQKLIDSAGETQFTNIYTKMKDEIKNTIITKLLSKLEKQTKQIEEYKQEIISLKNDLTYILKRVLLLKNQNLKDKKNFKKFSRTSTNSKNNIFKEIKNNLDNSRIFYLNNSPNQLLTETNLISESNNTSREKVNNYLNLIYKKNLIRNSTGIGNKFLLGKNDNLYNEIFNTAHKNISEEKDKNRTYQKNTYSSHKNIFISVKKKLAECKKDKISTIKVIPTTLHDRKSETNLINKKILQGKTKIIIHNNNNFGSQVIDYGNKFKNENNRKSIDIYRPSYLTNKL